MGLLDALKQAVGGGDSASQFNQIAQGASSDVLAKGLAAAFASDQTPAIGNMAGQLFAQSNGAQQAGLLNQLIAALGPSVAGGLAGGVLGNVMGPGQTQVTPEQAAQLTPQQVQDVVNHANDVHPDVANLLGQFYAQHKGLINTLGGIAATVAMMKMKDHLAGK